MEGNTFKVLNEVNRYLPSRALNLSTKEQDKKHTEKIASATIPSGLLCESGDMVDDGSEVSWSIQLHQAQGIRVTLIEKFILFILQVTGYNDRWVVNGSVTIGMISCSP